MLISGEKTYVVRLDRIKLTTFLREQGMPEKEIASLCIHFSERKRRRWQRKTWDGLYSYRAGKHTITIATDRVPGKLSSYTLASQQETLYELNETLMHELKHALDAKNKKVQFSSLLLVLLCISFPLALNAYLVRVSSWGYLSFILILILGPKIVYRYSLLERRARAFEQTYGRRYLLFRW